MSKPSGPSEKAGGCEEDSGAVEVKSSPEVRSVHSSGNEDEHLCFVEFGDSHELNRCSVAVRQASGRGASSGHGRRADNNQGPRHPDEVHPESRVGQPRADLHEVGGA